MIKSPSRPMALATRGLERLEDRCLLSAAPHGLIHTIPFSSAPVAVQAGLDLLATNAGLTDPTATQTVFLGNSHGVETYTVDLSSTGTSSVLTVDQKGNPYTAPVKSTATYADITNTAVTNEIGVIVTALNLTAPDPTTSVTVFTSADKSATYTITLSATNPAGHHTHKVTLSIDSNGNPVGNIILPLSTMLPAVQNGLMSNAPAGATALTPTSPVSVRTLNGITTYSATYHATGITTKITVDNTGALANLPTTSTVQFSTIPVATQTQLQTLANANGFVGTISATQNVKAYDEANGTVIYSVRLPVTGTSAKSGATYTYMIVVAADQSGNPTVPPTNGHGDDGDGDGFGHGGFGFGFGFGGGWGWGGAGNSAGGPQGFSGFSKLTRAMGFRF